MEESPVTHPDYTQTLNVQQQSFKRVPIYHNAHKIYQAQQAARQNARDPTSPVATTTPSTFPQQSVTRSQQQQQDMITVSQPTQHPHKQQQQHKPILPPTMVTRQPNPIYTTPTSHHKQQHHHHPPPQLTIPHITTPYMTIPRPPLHTLSHHPMHPLPKQGPPPYPTMELVQLKESSPDPENWSIEQTIMNISQLDPALANHVETFRAHEIDGKALLLLSSEMMMKYLGMKLGPALKICNIIDKLKGKKHLPIG
jgi:hypothetical protein